MIELYLSAIEVLKAIVRCWRHPEFRSAFVLAVLILVLGTLFFKSVEGWNWIDALYFSVATVSTVGYGDLYPQTSIGKIFTVIYIFVGVGVFVSLFAQLARALLKAEKAESGSTGYSQE